MTKDILAYWGNELQPVQLDEIMRRELPASAVAFLTKIGLPSMGRVYADKKNFLARTIRPQLLFGGVTDDMVKDFPYFEFDSVNPKIINFEGNVFIQIGHHPSGYLEDAPILTKATTGEVFKLSWTLHMGS